MPSYPLDTETFINDGPRNGVASMGWDSAPFEGLQLSVPLGQAPAIADSNMTFISPSSGGSSSSGDSESGGFNMGMPGMNFWSLFGGGVAGPQTYISPQLLSSLGGGGVSAGVPGTNGVPGMGGQDGLPVNGAFWHGAFLPGFQTADLGFRWQRPRYVKRKVDPLSTNTQGPTANREIRGRTPSQTTIHEFMREVIRIVKDTKGGSASGLPSGSGPYKYLRNPASPQWDYVRAYS